MKQDFLLDPNILYLNHGSYGATPKGILQQQQLWREKMEYEPVQFMMQTLPGQLIKSRAAAADFLGVDIATISCITNATTGVQAILSQKIHTGMNVVCTNHRYQAVYNALHYTCDRQGANLLEIPVPFGTLSPQQLLEYIWESIPENTDFILLDEISSATAIRFPIAELCARIKRRNSKTEIFIDGAHSPGHVDTDFSNIDYWTGNLHKWCCAPKGCALLYVRTERQQQLHAPVISHGYRQGFQEEMWWMGTHDPTAYVCIPEVLKLHEQWGGKEFRQKNHQLMQEARALIIDAFPDFIVDDSTAGLAICSFLIPFTEDLYNILFHRYNIEIFVHPIQDKILLRISCFSAYNALHEYQTLIQALKKIGY